MATALTQQKFSKLMGSLRLDRLPLSEQDEITLQLNALLFKSALVHFLEQLSPKEREAYKALIDRGASLEECASFLKGHKKLMDQSVAVAVDELAGDILGGTT